MPNKTGLACMLQVLFVPVNHAGMPGGTPAPQGMAPGGVIKGWGTALNPKNRFERLQVIQDLEQVANDAEYLEKLQHPLTQYLADSTKSIVASNDSPDVPFTKSINPHRGCSHGWLCLVDTPQ